MQVEDLARSIQAENAPMTHKQLSKAVYELGNVSIDLMHWRHVSITTTPCWGSRLVALRAHVLLAERIDDHPLSQCAHPGQLGGVACRGLPSECMLDDGARGVPRLTPNTTGAPFCDVICIWSIHTAIYCHSVVSLAVCISNCTGKKTILWRLISIPVWWVKLFIWYKSLGAPKMKITGGNL